MTATYHVSSVITNMSLLKCWGSNTFNILGLSLDSKELPYSSSPEEIEIATTSNDGDVYAKDLAVGWRLSCIITSTKELQCWGWTDYLLMNYTKKGMKRPTSFPTSNKDDDEEFPVQVALGASDHMCIVTNNNIMKCAGQNEFGEIGDGSNAVRDLPTAVDLEQEKVEGVFPIQMSLGYKNTCAVMSDGHLKCWGSNRYGKLGDGTRIDRFIPITSSSENNV